VALQDKDLQSIQEVRNLVARAHDAQKAFEKLTQTQVDHIVGSMGDAAVRESTRLGVLAVEETGYGIAGDKHIKNYFVAKHVTDYIRPLRTMGIISEDPVRKVTEIAVPMGVVAAIIPSTNPTSTAIFKCLISLKAGNAVVLSPHPAAARCIGEAARVCYEAALQAGAPEGIIGWMTIPTLEATQELMKHKNVALILATGGAGLVKAAYSSGKPAYGVGPGNVPAYVDRSADISKAVKDVLTGKTFDNGTLCSSEQSIIVDAPVESQVTEELVRMRGYFLDPEETRKLETVAIQPSGSLNPQVVGKSPAWIADKAGIKIPEGTRVLIVRLNGVGRGSPLSCEKLSPILSYYVVKDWREGCERCKQILAYGGMGHTLAIHSKDPAVIRQFGLEKPAFRICVNTPATHGSIGYSTSLPPSMTLGCGTYGNNITTDNITPMHLIQVKRLAWETTEVFPSWWTEDHRRASETRTSDRVHARHTATSVPELIEAYLESWKARQPSKTQGRPSDSQPVAGEPDGAPREIPGRDDKRRAVDFVCEQDVRKAAQLREKIYVHSKTIITPAAQELGTSHKIFVTI
jgi:acetaldehyde dehydrogenase (acetylating)